MRDKKDSNMYMKVYNTQEAIDLDQTRQFPKKLQRNNQYIMVMVKIDNNFILVKPMTSCTKIKICNVPKES